MFSAPVTAVKVLDNRRFCFAGTGPYILAFDLITNEQLFQEKIFDQSVVHGFEIRRLEAQDSFIIVVFGQKTFSIVRWSIESCKLVHRLSGQIQSPSWILSAMIVNERPTIESIDLIFGTALNQIYRYQYSTNAENSVVLSQSFKYTTLYSSTLFRHSDGRIFFAAGTVFGELILYEEDEQRIFHERHSIFDHRGAIFGITYHRNLLSTVADDRMVKMYRFDDQLTLVCSFFAHEARVWRSSLTSTNIISCGEDSSIRVWSQNSTKQCLRCFSVHRCKSCWSIDIIRDENDDLPLLIVSGWSDGAVRRFHLDDVPYDFHEPIGLSSMLNNDFPRNVVFIDRKTLLVHTSTGQLLRVEQASNSFRDSLFFDGRSVLKNAYAKMVVNHDEPSLIAVGSLDGQVLIFNRAGEKIDDFQITIKRNNKILQLLWLNSRKKKLLVCLPEGVMIIYELVERKFQVVHRLDILPDFEQRWPNACLYLGEQELLLIGDRQGNLLIYDLRCNDVDSICQIHQQFDRLHGINGTSSIDIDPKTNVIRTCGRDGYINLFVLDDEQRQLIHQTTITISAEINWLDRLTIHPSLVTCFTTNHFCLFTCDEQSKRRLMQVDCGGGHRNNDFMIDEELQAQFTYVRNKRLHLARKQLNRILNESTCLSRTPPTHGIEIRSVKLFHRQNELCLITGGEDTQIKVFQLNNEKPDSFSQHFATLQSHLSAVCDITLIDSMIFSCGARAQLFAWQIKDNLIRRSSYFMLHPLRRRHGGGGGGNITDDTKKDASDDDHGLDVRFTSVAAMKTEVDNVYLIFVTGSDSLLRIFRFNSSSNRFTLLQTSSHSEYCQLRVKVFSPMHLTFASSTDGLICAYDFSSSDETIRISPFKIHQSGVNDFDLISLNKGSSGRVRLISVGDDGSVHVSIFDKIQWTWIKEYSQEFTHHSPATGTRFFTSTSFISVGIDQRLKLWHIDEQKNELIMKHCHMVDIRDILAVDSCFSETNQRFIIVIAGADVHLNTLRMQCLMGFVPWKKVAVRGGHLLLVCSVVSSLIFEPSDLRAAIDQKHYFYFLSYACLVYLSLFFYFLTCFTDPGYVPYRRIFNSAGNMDSTSDEDDDVENSAQNRTTTSNKIPQLRKCLICNIQQPLRSHHCDFCNRCVLKYDHHCPYLETCIGEYNHRYFWCFLLTMEILIIWSIMICSDSFVPQSQWSLWLHINKFRLFAMHVLVVSVCATTALFCIHSFFALTNSTTWERVSRHRITYLNRLPDEDLNPFHQGYCHNFFYSFLCHRVKEHQWDVIYNKSVEEHVTLNM